MKNMYIFATATSKQEGIRWNKCIELNTVSFVLGQRTLSFFTPDPTQTTYTYVKKNKEKEKKQISNQKQSKRTWGNQKEGEKNIF